MRLLAAGGGVAAALAVVMIVAVPANFTGSALPVPPTAGAPTTPAEQTSPDDGRADDSGISDGGTELPHVGDLPAPTPEDGHIVEGAFVGLSDVDVPAIARLDPALLAAMRAAETDAAADGIRFQVTSGWRSEAYQRWLLADAIQRYRSEELAREFVATPERSQHVTGDAVDIAPLDAQLWLMEHGSRYGICQTYSNERWHFELATEPGGVCPEMKADASA